MSRTVSSIIGGRPATDAPGGACDLHQPGRHVGDRRRRPARRRRHLRRRLPRPRARRSAAWAAVPAPVRGRAIQQIGRLVEDNKEALARLVTREIGKPYAESLGEVQEIVDTCNFFVGEGRRLYGQTVPSEMSDKQLFTFRNAGRRGRHHHRRQLPGGGAVLVPRPRAAVRQRRGRGSRPSTRRRWARRWPSCSCTAGLPDGVLNLVLCRRPADLRRPRAGARRGPGRQGRLHRLERRGRADRRAVRAPPAVAVPGARRQEPAGRHARRRPRPRRRGRAVQRLRHRRPALHVAGHRDRPRVACTTSSSRRLKTRGRGRRDRRPVAGRALRPDDPRALPGALRCEWLGLIRDHHTCPARPRTGRITRRQPARGLRRATRTPGLFCHPTLVDGVRARRRALPTETFGPIVGVAAFGDFDEAIDAGQRPRLRPVVVDLHDRARSTPSASASASARAWSASTTPPPAPRRTCPFGGNGKSGNGSRQSGIWVLDQFTRWQALNWDYAGKLQKAQMDVADLAGDLDYRLEE